MGARAVEALPELTRMLSRQQISVRQSPFVWRFEYDDLRVLAANAIEAIGRDAIPAAPALIAAYARADDSLEIVLTQALRSLFHDDVNRNALRPIFDGFRSPNERIRSGARRVLAELVDEDGIRLLLGDTLDDPDPLLRLGAAQTLESLGEAALSALEKLRRHRDDPDPDVRRAIRAVIEGLESSKE